ncbi:hypothetical protein BGW42_006981 [Actinomortierella wolfii]|nr:hypothetical protein BGW42_006981 [Actinomortierella wolfii]
MNAPQVDGQAKPVSSAAQDTAQHRRSYITTSPPRRDLTQQRDERDVSKASRPSAQGGTMSPTLSPPPMSPKSARRYQQQQMSESGRPGVHLTQLPMDILLMIASPRFLTIQDIVHWRASASVFYYTIPLPSAVMVLQAAHLFQLRPYVGTIPLQHHHHPQHATRHCTSCRPPSADSPPVLPCYTCARANYQEHELVDILERLTKILLHPDFQPRLLRSSYSFRSSSVGNSSSSRQSGRRSRLDNTMLPSNKVTESIRRVRRDLQDYPIFMTGNPPDLVRLAIEFGYVPFVDHLLHRGFRPRDLPEYFRQIPILEDPRTTHRCHRYVQQLSKSVVVHGGNLGSNGDEGAQTKDECAWGKACPHRSTAVEAHEREEYEQIEPYSEDDTTSTNRKKMKIRMKLKKKASKDRWEGGAQETGTDTTESDADLQEVASTKHQSTPSLLLSPFIQLKQNLRKKSKQHKLQREMQQPTPIATPEGTADQERLDSKGKGKHPLYALGDEDPDHYLHHHQFGLLHHYQPYPSLPHHHLRHHAQALPGTTGYPYKPKTDSERMYELHRIWECVSVANQELVDACANADLATVQRILNATLIHPRQSLEERAAAAAAAATTTTSSMQPFKMDEIESSPSRAVSGGGGGGGAAMSVGMSTGASAPASVSMPPSTGGGDFHASGIEDSSSERRASTGTAQTLCSADSHHAPQMSGTSSGLLPYLTSQPISTVTPSVPDTLRQHAALSASAQGVSMHAADFSLAESGITAATLVDPSTIFRQRRRLPSEDSDEGSSEGEAAGNMGMRAEQEQQRIESVVSIADPVSPGRPSRTESPLEPVHMPWVDGRALTSALLAVCFRRDGFQSAEAEAEEEARAAPIVAELLKYDSMFTAQALGQAIMALAYSRRAGAVKRRSQLAAATAVSTTNASSATRSPTATKLAPSVFDLVLERIGPREWLKLIKYYLQRQEFEDLAIVLERCPFKGQAMEEYNQQRGGNGNNGNGSKRGGGPSASPSTGFDGRIHRTGTLSRSPAVESRPGEICREAGVCGVGTRLNFTGRGTGHGTVNTTSSLYGATRTLFTGNGTRFNNTLMLPRGGFRGIGGNNSHAGTSQARDNQSAHTREGFGGADGHDDVDDVDDESTHSFSDGAGVGGTSPSHAYASSSLHATANHGRSRGHQVSFNSQTGSERDPERSYMDVHDYERDGEHVDDDNNNNNDDDDDGHDNGLAFGGVGSSTTSSSRPGPGIVGIAIQVQAPEYILEALLDMGFRFFSISDLSISDTHHPLALKFRQQEKMNRQLIEFCMVPNLETRYAKKLAKRRFVSERSSSSLSVDPKGKGKKVVYNSDPKSNMSGPSSPHQQQEKPPLQKPSGQESDDSEERRAQATVQSFLYPAASLDGAGGAASMPTIPQRKSSLAYASKAFKELGKKSNGDNGNGGSGGQDASLQRVPSNPALKPLPPLLLPPVQLGESFEQLTLKTMMDERDGSKERSSLAGIRSTQMALQLQLQQRPANMSASAPLDSSVGQRSLSPPMSPVTAGSGVDISNNSVRLQRTMTQQRILEERTRSVVREYLSSKYVDLMTVGICLHQACYNKNEHLLSVLLEHRLLIAQDALTGAVQVAGSVGWRRGLELLLLQQGDLEAELEPTVTMTTNQIHAGSCVRWDQASAVPLLATQSYGRGAAAPEGFSALYPGMAYPMSANEGGIPFSGHLGDPSSSSSPSLFPSFHPAGASSSSAAASAPFQSSYHHQGFSSSGGSSSMYYPYHYSYPHYQPSMVLPPPPMTTPLLTATPSHDPTRFHLSISALAVSPTMMMTRRYRNAVVAFLAACSRNDPALVDWLVKTYADIKVSHLLQGMMIACDRGWVDVVKVLVGSSMSDIATENKCKACAASAATTSFDVTKATESGKSGVSYHEASGKVQEQQQHSQSCPRNGRNLFRQWLAHMHQKVVELDTCCAGNESSQGNISDDESEDNGDDDEEEGESGVHDNKSSSLSHHSRARSTNDMIQPHDSTAMSNISTSSPPFQKPPIIRAATWNSMSSGTGLRELREQTMPQRHGPLSPPPSGLPSPSALGSSAQHKSKSMRALLLQGVGCLSIFHRRSHSRSASENGTTAAKAVGKATSAPTSSAKRSSPLSTGLHIFGERRKKTGAIAKQEDGSSSSPMDTSLSTMSSQSAMSGHNASSIESGRGRHHQGRRDRGVGVTSFSGRIPSLRRRNTTTSTSTSEAPETYPQSAKAPATPELHLIYLLEASPLFRFYFQILNSLDSCSFVKHLTESHAYLDHASTADHRGEVDISMGIGVGVGARATEATAADMTATDSIAAGTGSGSGAGTSSSIRRPSVGLSVFSADETTTSAFSSSVGGTGGNSLGVSQQHHPSTAGISSNSGEATTGSHSGSGTRSSLFTYTPATRARKQSLIQAMLEPLLERFSPTDIEFCFRYLMPARPQPLSDKTSASSSNNNNSSNSNSNHSKKRTDNHHRHPTHTHESSSSGLHAPPTPSSPFRRRSLPPQRSVSSDDAGPTTPGRGREGGRGSSHDFISTNTTSRYHAHPYSLSSGAGATTTTGGSASDWLWPLDPDVVEYVEREARWYREYIAFVQKRYHKYQRRWWRRRARRDRRNRILKQRQQEKDRIRREMQIRLEEAQHWQKQSQLQARMQKQQSKKEKQEALKQKQQMSSFGVTSEIYDEKCPVSPCSSMEDAEYKAAILGNEKELPPLPSATVVTTAMTPASPHSLPSSSSASAEQGPQQPPQHQLQRRQRQRRHTPQTPKTNTLPNDIRQALQTTPTGATTIIRATPTTSCSPTTSSSNDPSTPSSFHHRLSPRQRWSNIWTRVQHVIHRND